MFGLVVGDANHRVDAPAHFDELACEQTARVALGRRVWQRQASQDTFLVLCGLDSEFFRLYVLVRGPVEQPFLAVGRKFGNGVVMGNRERRDSVFKWNAFGERFAVIESGIRKEPHENLLDAIVGHVIAFGMSFEPVEQIPLMEVGVIGERGCEYLARFQVGESVGQFQSDAVLVVGDAGEDVIQIERAPDLFKLRFGKPRRRSQIFFRHERLLLRRWLTRCPQGA